MIVKSRILELSEAFITEKGDVINEAVVAYEAYGNELGPVIFITHGGLSSHHFMINALRMDPEFNHGQYEIGKPKLALNLIQQIARIYYIHERFVKERFWDPVVEGKNAQEKRSLNIAQYLRSGIEEQIEGRDPNCYIRLLNAINGYDLGSGLADYETGVRRIKCPVLLVNISTDSEFPPYWAEALAEILNKTNPGQAQVRTLDSPWGHMGCVQEGKAIGEYISEFLATI